MHDTLTQHPFPVWEQTQYIEPLGTFCVVASETGLVRVELIHQRPELKDQPPSHGNEITAQAILQIKEYLQGNRKVFSLPIDWRIFTPFQARVVKAAIQVAYGQITTYGELAQAIQQPQAARAVGGVMSRNPILLIIPCHRVVSAQRRLAGYSAPGGLKTKQWLLSLEGHHFEHQELV